MGIQLERDALVYNVLCKCFEDLVKFLNFTFILPYLSAKLKFEESELHDLVDNDNNRREKAHKIVTNLCKCGEENYFEVFLSSLRESALEENGAGPAHSELADTLEQEYHKALELSHTEKRQLIEYYRIVVLKDKKVYLKQFFSCQWIACYIAVFLAVFLIGLLPIAILSHVPQIRNGTLIVSYPKTVYGNITASIEFDALNPFQTLTMGAKIDGCEGKVFVIDGATCENLDNGAIETVLLNTLNENNSILPDYIYLLPHSLINIYIPDENFGNLELWIAETAEAYNTYLSLKNKGLTHCDSPPPNCRCCRVNDHNGTNSSYTAPRAEFYSVDFQKFFPQTTDIIKYDFIIKRYNLSNIRTNYSPRETHLTAGKMTTVQITKRFQFRKRDKCVLLQSLCPTDRLTQHDVTIIPSTSKRSDVFVFPGVIIIIGIVLFMVVTFVHITYFVTRKKLRGREQNGDVGNETEHLIVCASYGTLN